MGLAPPTMKAIALQNSFVKHIADLSVSDVPAPIPKPDELLVSIAYAAIQHVDLLYARGLHQNNHIGLVAPPFILGLEYSGVVSRAPPGSPFQPGDRVFGGGVGAFAEQHVAKASQLSRVPETWSLREAAGVGSAAHVSYGAVVRCGQLRRGEAILVHAAAGGLGVMAVQIALALGARVVATVGSEEKMHVVRALGVRAGDVLSYRREGWEKEVLKLTGGRGVDLTYDTVGLVRKSISCSCFRGRVVVAGFAGRNGEMEKLAMNRVLLKNVQLLGYRYGETGRRDPRENEIVSAGVAEMIGEGKIKPVVYQERYEGLESVVRALTDSAERRIWGKGVVDVNPGLDQTRSRL